MDHGGRGVERAAHAGGRVGPDPASLVRRAAEAEATGLGGDPWRARDLFAGMLLDHDRVFGPGHPVTLGVLGRLGHWAGRVEDFATSRAAYEDLYRRRCAVQGEEHEATLDALARLAEATGHAGDPLAACDLHVRLLARLRRQRGPTHRETLEAMSRLAQWLACTGRAARARDLFAELALSLVGTPGEASDFARESLAYWQRRVGQERRLSHLDVRERRPVTS
ncbi:tetratricopeptide repeat protein [Actinosynnema sp. NPDC004786]